MVKNLKIPFRKKLFRTNSTPKSPEIQLNNEMMAQNTNIFESEEELYSKVENYLSQSSGSNSSFSDLGLSSTSLNVVTETDSKNMKKEKRMKKKLSEEGNKHIAELIAYLHSDKPLVKTKLEFDGQDFQLLNSREEAVDLDKYFKEKKPLAKTKLWKTPIVFSKRDDRNVQDNSSNGSHPVNRFGDGVADGCSVSLSLKSKGKDFGDVFHRPLEWSDIIEEADQVLFEYEHMDKKMSRRGTRRGSLLQPRIIFLSPHPEVEFERVLQSASCLPLRSWTSELFLDSKESSELLDSETKRNLKWNTSLEDFRHLLSPELSHFGNDVYSMMVEAKRRLSLCPPQQTTQSIPFRRNSYRNGEVWAPIDPNKPQKTDYDKKLEVIRQSSSDFRVTQTTSKTQSTNSLLTVPNDEEGIQMTKNRFKKREEVSEESHEFFSTENIDPKVMANELTLIAKELLLSIKNTEIIILLIRPHSVTPESCPHIIGLLGFQKRVIQLITSYILDETDVETCAKRMAYFIEVAHQLKSLRNWHSVYSVITSLQSPPIARLRRCWQIISDHFSDSYCEFIEMSEQIKKEINPLDYTSPSIPLFNDLMDDLKERCGSKFFEIKKHRFHSNWTKRETVAVWVDQQIIDLVDTAKDKKKIQKRVEKIRKNSKELKNKGLLKRMISKNTKEYSESVSGGSVSDGRTDSITSSNTESKFRSKLSAANSPVPSCKNIWSVTDFQKLREYDEKEILEEIARGLVHYQKNVTYYYLSDSNEMARSFLLLHPYQEFQICINKSYRLEEPKSSKTSSMPQIIID